MFARVQTIFAPTSTLKLSNLSEIRRLARFYRDTSWPIASDFCMLIDCGRYRVGTKIAVVKILSVDHSFSRTESLTIVLENRP
jgi:hypothetical protein